MRLMSRVFGLALLLAAVLAAPAFAQSGERVEVIQVAGIVDSSVERAVINNIEQAERDDAAIVVLQIDSMGVVDEDRTDRITAAIEDADVPVAAWVGPPGAQARNGATLMVMAARLRGMAPGAILGPLETADLRRTDRSSREATPFTDGIGAEEAEEEKVIDVIAPSIDDFLAGLEEQDEIDFDRENATVRFHQLDLFGRLMHAAAQPSVAYLLLLVGLIGIVFELFHPSNGPAGVSGLAALALAIYGIATLGGSWAALALVVAGVAAFCVDLRYSSLGAFSAGGLVALIAGSILLFTSPYLRPSPLVLAFGIIAMVTFLVSAMTRVLRDLRAVARGELEVTDAHPHPHPEGQGGPDET